MRRLLRYLLSLHRTILHGEPYTALWAWVREHWRELVAVTGLGGIGTFFASGINFINSLGWGAWPFAGALFAAILSSAFLAIAKGRSLLAPIGQSANAPHVGNPPSPEYVAAVRRYVKVYLEPAYDAAIAERYRRHIIGNYKISDIMWRRAIAKIEEKTALPYHSVQHGLRDDLFEACGTYLVQANGLRIHLNQLNSKEANAYAGDWIAKDRVARERFRELRAFPELAARDDVFELFER